MPFRKITIVCMLVALLALAASFASAQEWVTANQLTVGWEPVTMLKNGDPVPVGDTIEYAVYLAAPDKTGQVKVGQTAETQFTITFTDEGRFLIGVQTLRTPEGETVPKESNIAWSDDPVSATVPFGAKYYVPASDAKGLHVVSP